MTWQTGIFEDIPFDVYAAVDALNGSSLVHMRRSPMRYQYERHCPSPPSDAMRLGIVTHRMILEGETLKGFAVWGEEEDQKVRRGKVWDAFQDENFGKEIITVAERQSMLGIVSVARENALFRQYIDADGPTEVSIFWQHPHTKRRMKARLDKYVPSMNVVADVKTTRDCHSYKFGSQSYSMGYHLKMALQWQGIEVLTGNRPHMRLLAIDSKPPHESAVYRMTTDTLLQGLEEADVLIARLTECEATNKWPAEHEEETDLVLPSWAMGSEFEDLD